MVQQCFSKLEAKDARCQRELEHPDYQSQPRKPSEKKKRMTKNRLAKIAKVQVDANDHTAVQQPLPDHFDPLAMLNNSLGVCVGQPMQLTGYSEDPIPRQPVLLTTSNDAAVVFHSGPDIEDRLRASLAEFNEQVPTLTQTVNMATLIPNVGGNGFTTAWSTQTIAAPAFGDGAFVAQPTVNGRFADDMQSFPIDIASVHKFMQGNWEQEMSRLAGRKNKTASASHGTPRPRTAQPFVYDPTTEVERQTLLDADFHNFIDMSVFGNSPSPNHVGPAGFDYVAPVNDVPDMNEADYSMLAEGLPSMSSFDANFEIEYEQDGRLL